MAHATEDKIVELRGYWLEHEMSRRLRNAVGFIERRSALALELVTESGRSGWGETQGSPLEAWQTIERSFARHVLGHTPFDTNGIRRALFASGRRGEVTMMAVSAIDIALWDLRGRLEGVPIATLLGGPVRGRVGAYASGPLMALGDDPYRDALAEATGLAKEGFRALKLRSGHTPRADAEIVMTLRRELGPDFGLMIDVNQAYSRHSAAEVARRCEEAALGWIEEPLDPFDFDGYVTLARSAPCAIAGGESLSRLGDFRDVIARGAVGIVQPDVFFCGGITGAMKISALAEAYSVPYLPHVFGSAINFYASLQLAATLPSYRLDDNRDYPLFEFDRSENPLRTMLGEPKLNDDGTLTVPEGPGIGVEVDREQLRPHTRQAWQVGLSSA